MTQYPTAEMIEDLDMAIELIQEAKGADGPDGGFVTNHLDAAEHWLRKVSAAIAAMRAKEQSHSPTGDDVEHLKRQVATLRRKLAELGIEEIEDVGAHIATLATNGVSQPAAEERIARLSLDVGRLLAADPICGGRVSGGTVQAIATLATQPASDTGLREALADARQRWQQLYDDENLNVGVRNFALGSINRIDRTVGTKQGGKNV